MKPALFVPRAAAAAVVAATLATSAFAPVSALGQSTPVGTTAPARVPGSPAGVTAFVGVSVIPMDRERVLADQTVLVEAGRITTIGSSATVRVPGGATRVDGRGKFLIPGLADMHAHLVNGTDSAGAERRLALWLLNGVTTVRNMDYFADSGLALRLRARADSGVIWSPRIYTSGYLPYGTLDGTAERVKAYKAAGYDFIKIHDQRITDVDSITAVARALGIPYAGHVPEAGDLDWTLKTGYASIEHLHVYIARLVQGRPGPERSPNSGTVDGGDAGDSARLAQQLDLSRIPAVAAATAKAGVWNCPTQMLSEVLVEGSATGGPTWPEARYAGPGLAALWATTDGTLNPIDKVQGIVAARRKMIKALQAAGAGLLLGTDAPVGYLVPGFGVHHELQALVRAGLTPYQALAAGTRNVAAFLGRDADQGTIAVGKRADLVLLAGNPLKDITKTMNSAGVMIGGRWLPRAEIDRRLAAEVGKVDFSTEMVMQQMMQQ